MGVASGTVRVRDEHGMVRISGLQPTGNHHTSLTEMVIVVDKETGQVVISNCAYLRVFNSEVEMHSSRCNALSSVIWPSNCHIVDMPKPFKLVGERR